MSAGYCQNPGCLTPLFEDAGDKNVHIAEMAHIVAASDTGPRADVQLSAQERGAYENLVLLCASCHTRIDKAPEHYTDSMVVGWKQSHVARIAATFGAVEYGTRQEACQAIAPALAENLAIFNEYGPDNDYRVDSESPTAAVWRRKVLSRILPNNRKILAVLDANRRHLKDNELATLEQFRQHIDDLEARHLGDSHTVGARFPADMSTILCEGANA
ncbi:MAG: hypothetical protein WC211_00060 [Dehalococcoidia bacterium]